MPSMKSVLMRIQMRLFTKPLIARWPTRRLRSALETMGEWIKERAVGDQVQYESIEFENFQAQMANPTLVKHRGVILYLHGGGYATGMIKYATSFGGILCRCLGMPVLCIAYRLAPESPFPAALEDALSAYRHLLDAGYAPKDITLIGESAGGGLVFCLVQYLKQQGIALPGRLVAISPWGDLTLSGESYAKKRRQDPMLSYSMLSEYVGMYVGQEDPRNPLISPIFGDLSGFPKTQIYVGSREMLLDDARELKRLCDAADVPCELTVEKGLWHVYVLFPFPESQAALARIESFIKED